MPRWLKILLIVAAVIIGSAAAGLYYLANKYESILKDVLITQLNEVVNTPVEVSSISVSPFSELPFISLELNDVFIPDNINSESDTLLYLKTCAFHFNVLDILNERYRAQRISLLDGHINLLTDEKGNPNYRIWKTSDSTSNFYFNLDQLYVRKLDFLYHDQREKVKVDALVYEGILSGSIETDSILAHCDLKTLNRSLVLGNASYVPGKTIEIESPLKIMLADNRQFVGPASVVVDQTKINGKASFGGGNSTIRFGSKGITVAELRTEVPLFQNAFFKGLSGRADIDLNYRGRKGAYTLDGNYRLKNYEYKIDTLSETLKGSVASGQFSYNSADRGQRDSVTFELPDASLNTARLNIDGKIQNLNKPGVAFDIQTEISAELFSRLTGFDSIVDINDGDVFIDLSSAAQFAAWDDVDVKSFIVGHARGQFNANGLSFEAGGQEFTEMGLNGSVDNDQWELTKVEGSYNDQHFTGKGMIDGLMSWVYGDKKKLAIACRLELDDFIVEEDSDSSGTAFSIPDWLAIQAGISLNQFEWGRFTASNLRSDLKFNNGQLSLQALTLNTCGGFMKTDLVAKIQKSGNILVQLQSDYKGLDVHKLFYSFQNFGQDVLVADHLKGFAKGRSVVQFLMSDEFEILNPSIQSTTSVAFTDGSLKDFEPLQATADYFESNIILKRFFKTDELRKKLRDIQFETIRNDIIISNQMVHIPAMTISSSLMDLNLEGNYSFEHQVDFSMDFYLDELFSKDKPTSEYGEIQDDQEGERRVFLKMTGDISSPDFAIDKERRKAAKKEKVEKEKQIIKQVIKEEIESGAERDPYEGVEDFEIEWDPDVPDTSGADTIIRKDSSAQKKGLRNWLKKMTEEETVTPELEFDEDDL